RSQPYLEGPKKKQIIEVNLEDMLQKGVARPSNSSWASPVVIAKKKDGSDRFCVDYRRINAFTRKDAYPLPNIERALATLSGAKYFSVMDLQGAFWQVPMAEHDIEKTAFTCEKGLYEFTVTP